MVQTSIVEQSGFGRWTKYVLKIKEETAKKPKILTNEEKILAYLKKHDSINNAECRKMLSVDFNNASYLLKKLSAKSLIRREGEHRWTRYRLP